MRAETALGALRTLAAASVCAACSGAFAQSYLSAPEPFAWEPTAGHAAVVWTGAPGDPAPECQGTSAPIDDDISQELPLGFTLRFGGAAYTTARVMSNGRLQFANRFCGHGSSNSGTPRTYPFPIPNANLARVMSVYGNDLDPSLGGAVTYATVGAAPSRSFVVTWTAVPEWNAPGSFFNLQIVVRERGDFVFRFGAAANPSRGKAQIGWQLSTSDFGLLPFETIERLAGTAVRWIPRPAAFAVEAAQGGPIGAQAVGSPFAVRLTALDAAGGVLASFSGTATVSSNGPLTAGAGTTAAFIDGVLASHTVTIGSPGTFTLTASAGAAGGTSNPFEVRPLSAYLIAEYRMDEASWSGVAGEVLDASGNGLHGRAVNALTAAHTPALPGSPGTCGYGVFNRNDAFVDLPATFPNLQGSFTIAGWIRPTVNVTGDQRIFADDQNNADGIGLSLGDGGAGRLRFFSRRVSPVWIDSTPVIALNAWTFVAAVHDAANRLMSLSAFDATGAPLGQWSQTYTGSFGADNGRASIGGENAAAGAEAVPRWRFGGNIDELKIYGLALTQAQVGSLIGLNRACPRTTPAPSGFNAFDVTAPAGATAGPIRTKVSGAPFSLAVVALGPGGTRVMTDFSGTVAVELVDASNNAGALDPATNCRGGWTPIQALAGSPTFGPSSQGRVTVGFTEPNAWREVRVRMTYAAGPTAVVACSTDAFAIRPATFAGLQATDGGDGVPGTTRVLDNTSTTSGPVHRAGRAFSLLGQAVGASGAPTPGYAAASPGLVVTGCVLPSGCTPGVAASALSAVNGVVAGTATYDEAGVITALIEDTTFAAVDGADSTLDQRAVRSAPITIGRFIPDRYQLSVDPTPTLAPGACGAGGSQPFTFVGQPFGFATPPRVTVTPLNATGSPLANARPRFTDAHVSAALAAAGAPAALSGVPLIAGITHTSLSQVRFETSSFAFDRSAAAPLASYAPQFTFSAAVVDTTEPGATAPITGTLAPVGPLVFAAGDGTFRDGRVVLRPSYGDVRRDLVLVLEAQSFNGAGWVTLAELGACLVAPASAFAYGAATGALSAGGSVANCASRITGTVATAAGRAAAVLPRPGPMEALAPAAVTVTLNLLDIATGQTCSGSAAAPATTLAQPWLAPRAGGAFVNPSARLTWGRLRNDFISVRERLD